MVETILVVGGAGYIGAHTCKAVAAAGYRPVVYDNLCLGHRDFVRWGPLVEGDIRNSGAVEAAIRDYGCRAVMHFAAFAYVGESVTDPAKYYQNNVAGTLGLLEGMRNAQCDKLVFSSTCAVYGEPDVLPITEDTPTRPVNPYGRSKLMCETILNDYATAYDISFTALRYFNASGDDAESDIGELREEETHLIPRALMALQGYVDDFQVFGADFPTPDGTAIRDYIHVSDLADAHVAAMRHLLGGAKGGSIYNLGIGHGYSVGEVLAMIADVTGQSLPAPRGDRRPGDPAKLVADAAKARSDLGFTPRHSDLRNIIETAWRWHQGAHPKRNAA